MKTGHAVAVKLFGNLALIMHKDTGNGYPREERVRLTPEKLQEIKRKNAVSKRKRTEGQKKAEKVQIARDIDAMRRVAVRSNAGIKHLAYFIALIEHADRQGLPVSIFEMTKQMTEDAALKEWTTIRNWLGKGNAPLLCAVTIGRRPKGHWVLRVVLVGDAPKDDCYTLGMSVYLYLHRKRKWKGEGVAAEADAGRLKEHYLLRLETDEETFEQYVPEAFEVFRAGLAMPKQRRTFRTTGADKVFGENLMEVADRAAFVVNGHNYKQTSPSGCALSIIQTNKKGIVTDAYWVCEPDDPEELLEEVEEDLEETYKEF